MHDRKATAEFEAEVRRIAEAIWGLEAGGCQPEHYADNSIIRELDGIVRQRDVTHVIMATTSTKLTKAKSDVKKLNEAEKLEKKRRVPVVKWFVTDMQLDAEHIRYTRKHGVECLTLDQFKRRFFDGRAYIEKRKKGVFGSARNLANGSTVIPEDEYVPLPMEKCTWDTFGTVGDVTSIADIAQQLDRGETIALLAPFGAGKSLTCREIFLELSRQNRRNESGRVPIVLNLREHWGAEYPDEILERHARSIGFAPKENLTVAWRAGLTTLIIDGFDEVATQAVASGDARDFLRRVRFDALVAVRSLIREAPADSGILVCGRDHYFDDKGEMIHALGLGSRSVAGVQLREFTEEQANDFLQKHGVSERLPDWLPRKPLILGYLAHKSLLEEVLQIDPDQGFGYVWDKFLDLICHREAEHDRATMDPLALRRVLERIASDVRATITGAGPVTGSDLSRAYRDEVGANPGEAVLMQLQRLPGLTEREQDRGSRSFVDPDMLSALQGSALARMILEAGGGLSPHGWISGASPLAVVMAGYLLDEAGATVETVITAAATASKRWGEAGRQLAADCVMVALALGSEMDSIDLRGLELVGAELGEIYLETLKVDRLVIKDCHVKEVAIGPTGLASDIRFTKTYIGRVAGVADSEGLPAGMFGQGCEIETYDDYGTNNAVLGLEIPDHMKALITVLRKLYLQAGSGRKETALKKGLPSGPIMDAVDDVVSILQAEGVVTVRNRSVHPVRRQGSRIRRILSAPKLSDDIIVKRVCAHAN